MAETEATLVPDANGMLPNGLHQPTLNAVLVGIYTIADKEKETIVAAMKEGDHGELMHAVATVATLLSFGITVQSMQGFQAECVQAAIADAPEVLEKARQEQETGKTLKEKVEAMLMTAEQNPLDVN